MRVSPRSETTCALSITLLVGACGLPTTTAMPRSTRCASPTRSSAQPDQLVVAEQNGTQSLPWNLANAGKDAPYGVEFADFSGGAAVIEALRSGAADVGSIGEAPYRSQSTAVSPISSRSACRPTRAPAGATTWSPGPDSGITSIEQLRGKRVGLPPGIRTADDHRGPSQAARPRPQDRRATGRTRWGRGGSDVRGRCRRGGNRARQPVLPVG